MAFLVPSGQKLEHSPLERSKNEFEQTKQ